VFAVNAGFYRRGYIFGGAADGLKPSGLKTSTDLFPEPHLPAVRVPESFRGGCSFGAGVILLPVSPAGVI
jgi:hypothetical protein